MSRMIAHGWDVLLRKDPSLLDHPWRPLADLEACIRFFGLTPLRLPGQAATAAAGTAVPESVHARSTLEAAPNAPATPATPATSPPSFKSLTDEILLSLRLHLPGTEPSSLVGVWAEKLLRFVELRRRTIRTRALRKCGDPVAARLHVLHLACFLMDHAAFSRDPRFLNTALKLADLRWVLRRSALVKDLDTQGDRFIAALLQFRLFLTTEWGVAKLDRDGTL